jgi:PAS domain S-box-containing protein
MTFQNDGPKESSPISTSGERSLREKAEKITRVLGTQDLERDASGEVGPLRHELQVYQVELEMQNEELRRIREELELSQAKYFDLYDLAPVGYFTLSEQGVVLEANLTAADLLASSKEALVGRPFSQWIIPDDQDIFYRQVRALRETTGPQRCELRLVRPEGTCFWARLEGLVGPSGDDRRPLVRVIVSDISDYKNLEEELRRTKEELKVRIQERTEELHKAHEALKAQSKMLESFFQHTMNSLVFMDRDFNFLRVNQVYAESCQRPVSDFSGHNHFEFYPHAENEAIFRQVVETRVPYQALAKPFVFPDHLEWGTTYWDWTLTPLLDETGEVEFLVLALNDVTEHKKAEVTIEKNEKLLRTVIESPPFSEWAVSKALTRGETTINEEMDLECIDGGHKVILNSAIPILEADQTIAGTIMVNQDITARKELEKWTTASNMILDLFIKKKNRKDYLQSVADVLQWWTKCQYAGIRLKDAQGNIPFVARTGSIQKICAAQEALSVFQDQCLCLRVVQGAPEPRDLPMMTVNGSFKCNDMTKYLAGFTEKEQSRFMGTCLENPFSSVAVIPICYREKILGAVHLADKKNGRFPSKTIEFIETMVNLIGEAINRFDLEAELKENLAINTKIDDLLRLSLEDIELEGFLKEALDVIVALPWLEKSIGGCIYLVDDDARTLVLKTQRGSRRCCEKVPFGWCVCGQVVLKQATDIVQFSSRGHVSGMGLETPHVHYCIPIQSAGRTLGLINLLLPGDENLQDPRKEGFVKNIADTLAGIIIRKGWEKAIVESEKRLRLLSVQLLNAQELERRKIALEVHDVLGSSLSAIKFKVEDILQRIDDLPSREVVEGLEGLVRVIMETIAAARKIQADLRPPHLDDLGLVAALSWLCGRFKKLYKNIRVDQTVILEEGEVPEALKLIIFRVAQEAMNNVGQHANADSVLLGLEKRESTLALTISDNGQGFNSENIYDLAVKENGMGVSSMRERTQMSGGHFSIDSVIGRGTLIKAVWPV